MGGVWAAWVLLGWPLAVVGQQAAVRITPEEYIARWQEVAIRKMQEHGIPASITLAQGLLESNNGNSRLAREANNHFGIKCTSDWTGGKIYHDDDKKDDCFRKYRDAADSFEDHSRFLQRPRYAGLFQLKPTDYKGWAHGLKQAGYATDPHYPHKLINLIERFELDQLDKGIKPNRQLADAPTAPKHHRSGRHPAGEVTITIGAGREVQRFEGRIKYIKAKAGDNFKALADELEMMPGQLARYNDLPKDATLQAGQVIYLQPKRSAAKSAIVHTVRNGDTLWSLSQQYGVKLDRLVKYNGLAADAPLQPGSKVQLRKPRK